MALFEDTFEVTAVDPDGKKFLKGLRDFVFWLEVVFSVAHCLPRRELRNGFGAGH